MSGVIVLSMPLYSRHQQKSIQFNQLKLERFVLKPFFFSKKYFLFYLNFILNQLGGDIITLKGEGFVCSSLLRVKVGLFYVPAQFISSQELKFVAPKMQGGNAPGLLGIF